MALSPETYPRLTAEARPWVCQRLRTVFPDHPFSRLERVYGDVLDLFAGRSPDYSPIDLRYHDLDHSLQATVCMMELLVGRQASRAAPALSAAEVECGLVGALLHDCGYLKLRSDRAGTGAKYTFCHVLRSCAFAASYLPTVGFNADEIGIVVGAITCTGAVQERAQPWLQTPTERIIGHSLATADYLSQMAASDYPDKLPDLYREFTEAYDFCHVPLARRSFSSAEDMQLKTPGFWVNTVLPKLEGQFGGLYRYLAVPPPDGPNPYLEAVDRNLTEIQRRLSQPPHSLRS